MKSVKTVSNHEQTTNLRILDQILDVLRTGRSFCLSGHQNPDADVVGSQLALASLIHRLEGGRLVSIENNGRPPKNLSFLAGYESVKSVEKVQGSFDVLIVFECSGAERMGGIIDFSTQAKTVVNIDHHLHNPNFGTINYVEPHTSSTAEMIFKIFDRSGLKLSREEAICLFSGITADTGWFRYGNTTSQTHRIAARMLEAGLPVAEVAERAYMSRTETSVRLLGWMLTHMQLLADGRLAVLTLPFKTFDSFHATSDDLEEFVNHGLLVQSVRASVFIKEKEGGAEVKISIRSKGDLDINQVARKFGGGGHKNASGCSMKTSLDEAEKKVVSELLAVLG